MIRSVRRIAAVIIIFSVVWWMSTLKGRNTPHSQAMFAAQINDHQGLDRCGPMDPTDMQKFWTGTPYWNFGRYLGGENVSACQLLDSNWMNSVNAQGWGLVIYWVGLQAPAGCTDPARGFQPMSSNPLVAVAQGRQAAVAAYNKLHQIGVTKVQSILYLDIENYTDTALCRNAVNFYIKGWTRELFDPTDIPGAIPQISGLYANPGAIQALWNAGPGHCLGMCPININFASYPGGLANSVWGEGPTLPDSEWSYYQRGHQYRGPHDEWWNQSVPITVDSDCFLGQVAGGLMNYDPGSDAPQTAQQAHPTCSGPVWPQ